MLKTLVDVGVPLASKLKFISWNVNSLRAREPLVQNIIEKENPDVLCIQELKIDDSEYVSNFFKQHGYQTLSQTQKSYNGVSISLKQNIKFDEVNLLKLNEAQARNNTIILKEQNIALLNNYFPNGNPIDSEKFDFKIKWMSNLYDEIKKLKDKYEIIITGDFNVIPLDEDAHDIKRYKKDALAQPESRKEFYKYLNLDLIDIFEHHPKKQSYTFFDYKTYKFGKEEGIRIDFFLLTPFLKSKMMNSKVLNEYREMERPSDHCPVMMQLNI
jgi:exodeoxyribonuclease-3